MAELPAIGFIGLGIMGRPMAKNILAAGYPVCVWNRSRPGIDELVAAGATEGGSPRDVAAQTEIVVSIVTDSPDVEQVTSGSDGILAAARPGIVHIDMSTISPAVTRRLASLYAERGAAMLDAPVSGGDVGAKAGTLSIMVGGEEDVFTRCLPLLQTMGKNIVHVGPSGAGQTVKLCNQIVGGLNLLAMSECLAFAAKSGIDLTKMLTAVRAGAAGSWMLDNLAPRVVKRDFAPGFMVDLQQKDLRLALEAAEAVAQPLPGTSLVQQLFRAVQAHGGGREGTQALAKAIELLGAQAEDLSRKRSAISN